jgi:hypothetical protein
LTGILAILEKLRHLCNNHNIRSGHITLSCDRILALTQSLSSSHLAQSSNHLHADILSTSTKINYLLPITISPEHVKGHQDDNIKYSQLNRPAQLNTKMDVLAKETAKSPHLQYDIDYDSHHMALPTILYKGQEIQHQTTDTLYNSITGDNIDNYWISKNRFSLHTRNSIHWTALDKAMTSLNTTKRCFITKWASNNMGTGHKLVQWRYRHKENCPFCKQVNKDVPHLLQCSDKKSLKIWNASLWDYITKLHKLQTCNSAIVAIMRELQTWRENLQPLSLDNLTDALASAI